ncbi:hypothetical protein [Herbaspirillum sp. C7C8]|uniref:hypothetical protein n=1 Tax=Herbaspirillum sp. C7C8 TaxID=2736665 RepID=UPI001F52A0A8|nr:hypothetical protein [Herbaspirillum sp. C7C8]MCI1005028.1 hypothetical protein [Herbaspirillum sp. C7C8]
MIGAAATLRGHLQRTLDILFSAFRISAPARKLPLPALFIFEVLMGTSKVPMLKIVSDGSGMGTRLVMPDGSVVPGVSRIDLRPITSDGQIEAVITCVRVALDIDVSGEFAEQLFAHQD